MRALSTTPPRACVRRNGKTADAPGACQSSSIDLLRQSRKLTGQGPSRSRGDLIVPHLAGSRVTNILKGKRVLVTGGAGFIGSHLVELLAEEKCREIIVLDNMSTGRPENLSKAVRSGRVRLVVGDIRNELLLCELTEGVDTVFHQAALRGNHCVAEPRAALEVMVDGTFNLVEQCVRSKVRKIVFASASSIYGLAESFPTTERQNPYSNRTLHGVAKCFAEGMFRSFNE